MSAKTGTKELPALHIHAHKYCRVEQLRRKIAWCLEEEPKGAPGRWSKPWSEGVSQELEGRCGEGMFGC